MTLLEALPFSGFTARSGRVIQTGPPNQLVWMERGSVGDARISESRRDA